MMDEKFQLILKKQLAMNMQTWEALKKHGVTEQTQLRLDFFFNAPNKMTAEALITLIHNETDYDVAVRSEGVFRKDWFLGGKTQLTTISQTILNDWVCWMVNAGAQHNCEFDGWGAEVP